MGPSPLRYLTVSGVLLPDNRLLLQPGFLTNHPAIEAPQKSREDPVIAVLVDEEGNETLKHPLPTGPFCGDDREAPGLGVIGTVPWLEGTREIRFVHREIVVHRVTVPKGEPEVRFSIVPRTGSGRQRIAWEGRHSDAVELHYVLGYSCDDGESWQPLRLLSPESEAEVDFDALPGGKGRLVVHASDGVHTTSVMSDPFDVPEKGWVATILEPEDDAAVSTDRPLVLVGQAKNLETGEIAAPELIWVSEDGRLGEGPAIQAKLSPGRHEIRLQIGEKAVKAEASVWVNVR